MKDGLMVVAQVIGAIVAFAIGAWGLWCTWVAFFGGTIPLPLVAWESPGSFWLGLLFLFVVTPITTAVASQLFLWIFGSFFYVISLLTPSSSNQ
jgi:hypothetical protein